MDRVGTVSLLLLQYSLFPRPKLIPSGTGKPTRPHPLPRLQGLGQNQITGPLFLFLHLSRENTPLQ